MPWNIAFQIPDNVIGVIVKVKQLVVSVCTLEMNFDVDNFWYGLVLAKALAACTHLS